jgi:hypothetical protein
VNGNGAVAAGKGSDVWRASWRKGAYENDARGPARKTPFEAAQDYCDYINSGQIPAPMPALKSAGHAGKRASLPRDREVEYALGVLRDARAQRRGKQGYVYLIVEDVLCYGKVGFSTNPAARVAELQTGNPRKLRLLCSKPGTEADEAALHAKYAPNNVLQEWFLITKELLLEWDVKYQIKPAAQAVAV